MTAPTPAPELRDQLAEELGRHQGLRGPMDDERPDVWQNRCDCGWDDGDERPGWRERYRQHIADRQLLVVAAHVEQQAGERAAEELVDAAMSWRHLSERSAPVVKFLRARAAALRGQA